MAAKKSVRWVFLGLLVSLSCQGAMVDLRILETTDMHGNMMDFDYYKNEPTEKFGLVRASSLLTQARTEVVNTVLVDNGDLIQGSPMADYVAARGLSKGETHPVYKAMNSLNYTVGNIGNHEFNYGLEYLKTALSGAAFPYINANVLDAQTGKPYFRPYLIVKTPVKDREGQTQQVNIGYIGFVPPQIMQWDKSHLSGKVTVRDITETARQWVPKMREEGADVVIAIAHSGLSAEPYRALAENSVYYLSQVEGINAIAFGHAHAVFPGDKFANIAGVNVQKGTLNGIPAVMPGSWADHIGVIDLVLSNESGRWQVVDGHSEARPVYDQQEKKARVKADNRITQILATDHQDTLNFVNRPTGKIDSDLFGYLALVQDDATLQVIRDAQRAYVEHHVQGDPDLQYLPILSAAAPFKAGGRKNNPTEYIEIKKGPLTYRNISELYVFPNTLVTVKATGAEVKEWLECSAGMFNQIDPSRRQPQSLLNWEGFRTYNFDGFDGIRYQINVTQPARYDGQCVLQHPDAQRIEQLTFQGKPLDLNQEFLVVVNNYRAYTGTFPGTGEQKVAFAAPDEVRAIVADFIQKETTRQGSFKPTVPTNWKIAPIQTSIPLDIRVEMSPHPQAAEYIAKYAQYPMTYLENDQQGFAIYKINLTQK